MLGTKLIAAVAVLSTGLVFAEDKPNFDTATRRPYTPVGGKSINGKSIAEMRDKVKEMWGDIVFEKDGKKIDYVVTLETDFGNLDVEFYTDVAPNHARSFICLAKVGYFDGLKFHRCLKDFMIQGGCPLGTGSGGPGYCLKPEFNNKPHVKGVLSAARAQPKDSAGSQFFLCHGEARFLDGQYTAFGQVVKGIEVVDTICAQDMSVNEGGERAVPRKPIYIKKATVKIKGE